MNESLPSEVFEKDKSHNIIFIFIIIYITSFASINEHAWGS